MILDVIVAVILLISVIIAFLRGFIREVLTIFGIGGGVLAAYICGPLLLPYMNGWLGITGGDDADMLFDIIPYEYVSYALSYGVMFIVFVILLSILSHFLAEFAKNLGLGALDRTLGAVFGIVRGVFVLGLLYLPLFYLVNDEDQKEEWFAGSKSQIYLEMTSAWIDGFIPKMVEENLVEGVEKVKGLSGLGKKLEEMDLLKSTSKQIEEKKDGYTPEFRDNMDKMFEHNTDTSPDYNE
ncbi:MAG: colicin V production family protein [Alphaproteobacteria bacterium]|nr:MAG: colicin V production family protein [Alphaproteobacteria bacterium]